MQKTIDVDVPGSARTERTVTAEIEVPSGGYDLNIQEIYSIDGQIWVISSLTEEDNDSPAITMRVSDQVVLNAPDVPVQHYVVGDRPQGTYNEQYRFIRDRSEIEARLGEGNMLYQVNASVSSNKTS